jgi:glycosyltransferase involved in cell wall biosynthesis
VRVAVVFYGLPPEGGGAHTFGGSLLEAIRSAEPESRHSFVFYAAGGEPRPGVRTIPFTRRERYRRRAAYSLRDAQDRAGMPRLGPKTWFDRDLDEQGADLVWFATNYAEDCDLPFIFTVLDVEHIRQPWFPEVNDKGVWEQRQRYFSRYIPKATRVIVPNPAGAEQIKHAWGINDERILCLPHPTPRFALEAANAQGPADAVETLGIEQPYLLYPAQFWAHKNHLTALKALALLDGYELVLVGSDKGQLDHVRGLAAELGVADRVRFLGFVDTDDLVALYRHAHALTYLSVFGPENLPPLEAMALGCPVIAAAVPGAREQLGDAAVLVKPYDARQVADAVRRLENDRVRAELVEKGRPRAAARTAEGYVGDVIDFLDEFAEIRRTWS